jgi:hypothetical protein
LRVGWTRQVFLICEVADEVGTRVLRLGAGLGSQIGEVLAICGNAWAAANAYEELSRLSNAELERRGIPRGRLHRRVFDVLMGRGEVDRPS